MKLEAGQSVRSMIDVGTVGEERDVEVDSEEDTGFEAVLFGIRNSMRRRSGGRWLLRHAGHQLPQPPAWSGATQDRPARFPRMSFLFISVLIPSDAWYLFNIIKSKKLMNPQRSNNFF